MLKTGRNLIIVLKKVHLCRILLIYFLNQLCRIVSGNYIDMMWPLNNCLNYRKKSRNDQSVEIFFKNIWVKSQNMHLYKVIINTKMPIVYNQSKYQRMFQVSGRTIWVLTNPTLHLGILLAFIHKVTTTESINYLGSE